MKRNRLPGGNEVTCRRAAETDRRVELVLWMAAGLGFLILVHSILGKRTGLIYHFLLGLDYRDFYKASQALFIGGSPYDVLRYVTPPLPAVLNVPLSMLPFRVAVGIQLFLVPACILLAWWGVARLFHRDDGGEGRAWKLMVLATLLSPPFYFLMNRLNIDGVVLVLMAGVLTQADRRPGLSGFLLAVAVCFKIYPVLLLVPLVLYRNRRAVAGFGVSMLGFLMATPGLWVQFLTTRLWGRVDEFRLTENTSLHVLTSMLERGFFRGGFRWSLQLETGITYLIFLSCLILLGVRLVRAAPAHRPPFAVAALLFFPFMVAVPKLVYQYSLIILLAWIPLLGWLEKARAPSGLIRRTMTGLLLTQFPAIGWQRIFSSEYPNLLPAFGVALLIDVSLRVAAVLGDAAGGTGVQEVTDVPLE